MACEVIVTCEHGGNHIPVRYAALFAAAGDVLKTHRGWDPGALPLARRFAKTLGTPLFFSTTSRLLVDLNRSLHHPRVFSPWTKPLDHAERERIVARWYRPYRTQVEAAIAARIRPAKTVVHLSVHSFTPILDGRVRRADVGLLYDPARRSEVELCRRWRLGLRDRFPGRSILMNSPYRGTSDGFTTDLRTRYSPARYVGIELEINQKLPGEPDWPALCRGLIEAFRTAADVGQ